ncbi:hypothetical protein [Sphingomonas sp. TX0522]|uniref:hypothetical protein n=1 Tax=Sphingomonas sp. TX0522 TaxID=2479205 RepID=UPI0018DF3B42|nr:hypothetical protein [Sphingomonas sp. TX0522]MBI0533022.1 hypothetical protein [Sphingomonas sp. TX0522]
MDLTNRSDEDLRSDREAIDRERQRRLAERLEALCEDYVQVYGRDRGMEELGEWLLKFANRSSLYSRGWPGLINHLVKASG